VIKFSNGILVKQGLEHLTNRHWCDLFPGVSARRPAGGKHMESAKQGPRAGQKTMLAASI